MTIPFYGKISRVCLQWQSVFSTSINSVLPNYVRGMHSSMDPDIMLLVRYIYIYTIKSHWILWNPCFHPFPTWIQSSPRLYNSLWHLKFLPGLEDDHGGVNLDALGMELNCTSRGPWKALKARPQSWYSFVYIMDISWYWGSIYQNCKRWWIDMNCAILGVHTLISGYINGMAMNQNTELMSLSGNKIRYSKIGNGFMQTFRLKLA